MNVTEFAERVVFGNTLADKLTAPGPLSLGDAPSWGSASHEVTEPSRPLGLAMQHSASAAKLPSDKELENENARGRLLHFLANHELLATELMALVLLKFPEAPQAFRRGILVTLQEEQEHTKLYLERMKQCGVEFGSFPLSGHFWRIVEPMKSPMDFVSRLSLTFEQANLDFSLHFASVFHRIGDVNTAKILQRIYQDEIGHVQHGLHWFRQWKDPQQSDWQAYQSRLTFPMSPQRARGTKGTFNRDGRIQAGLNEEFIDAVEVFRQSRGRTPTVHWFDPGAESELAGLLSAREQQLLSQLRVDLECLLIAVVKNDDVLLVNRVPSFEFRKQLDTAGFTLPEFIAMDERHELKERKLHDLAPWAWTPNSHNMAKDFTEATHIKTDSWNESHTSLYRKSWSVERSRKWLRENDVPRWFASPDCVGEIVTDESDVAAALQKSKGLGHTHAIFKQDLATSGRGQRRLACDCPLGNADEAWLKNAFAKQKGIVEPELERVLDLSFLWHLTNNGPTKFLGWTRPLVNAGRRYCGTRLGQQFSDCDSEVTRFLLENNCERLNFTQAWLESRVDAELRVCGFRGHFGVDAFVFRNARGELAIKPLVELNPRMTMGHIALRLERRLAPRTSADFRILSRDQWDAQGAEILQSRLRKSADGRWQSGTVVLAEVHEQTKLVPVVLIGDDCTLTCT